MSPRVSRMQQPDNMPDQASHSRRRPPDEPPAEQPTSHDEPARDIAPTEPSTMSPSNLGRFLGGSDETDSQGGPGSDPAGDATISLSSLAGRRRVDPDLDIVQLNVGIPWYYRRALDLTATAEQVKLRRVVLAALDQVLSPQLLAQCRAAAERDRLSR